MDSSPMGTAKDMAIDELVAGVLLPELPQPPPLPEIPVDLRTMTVEELPMEAEISYPEDKYSICCVGCGVEMHLQMIPMRNEERLIIGWVFSCEPCRPRIVDLPVSIGGSDG